MDGKDTILRTQLVMATANQETQRASGRASEGAPPTLIRGAQKWRNDEKILDNCLYRTESKIKKRKNAEHARVPSSTLNVVPWQKHHRTSCSKIDCDQGSGRGTKDDASRNPEGWGDPTTQT